MLLYVATVNHKMCNNTNKRGFLYDRLPQSPARRVLNTNGEAQNIHQVLSMMNGHEWMHLGWRATH